MLSDFIRHKTTYCNVSLFSTVNCILSVCKWCCIVSHILFSSLIIYLSLPDPCFLVFLQKLSTGRSAWTLRRWRRRCAGAPRRTYWGRPRATLTSSLHFMTLSPAETTRSASLKVNNGLVLWFFSLIHCRLISTNSYVALCLITASGLLISQKRFCHVYVLKQDLSSSTLFPCIITEGCYLATWCYSWFFHIIDRSQPRLPKQHCCWVISFRVAKRHQ